MRKIVILQGSKWATAQWTVTWFMDWGASFVVCPSYNQCLGCVCCMSVVQPVSGMCLLYVRRTASVWDVCVVCPSYSQCLACVCCMSVVQPVSGMCVLCVRRTASVWDVSVVCPPYSQCLGCVCVVCPSYSQCLGRNIHALKGSSSH